LADLVRMAEVSKAKGAPNHDLAFNAV
jgi:hypothetical protein